MNAHTANRPWSCRIGESQTKIKKTENDGTWKHVLMPRGGHVTFCNMLHCCIAFCWLCRRPNVTLPQMNCHVQWFTVIKKRKLVALPWHCLYLDEEEQKNVKRMATIDQKLAGDTPLPRLQSESILSLAAVIQIHFDIEATASISHQPLNIRIVVMRTNEMWDEDDRKMIQIKTIRQCHENTMRRYK